MEKTRLTDSNIKILVESLKESIVDNYINLIYMINSTDLIFSFSKLRNKFAYISLNNNEAYFSLIENHKIPSQTVNKHNDYLKKFIKDSHIESVNQLNNDRLIEIQIKKSNDIFEREDYYIVLEFIPKSSNLIVLDKNKKILYAFKYKTLDNPHPILNGLIYDFPNKVIHNASEANSINEIEKYGEYLFNKAIEKKYKENFKPLYQYFSNRKSILSRKINVLEKEIDDAEDNEKYKTTGEMLLTLQSDKESLNSYIEENNVFIDRRYTISQNANLYFKKYKKEKKKIVENRKQIDLAKEELEEIQIKENLCQFLNNEELEEMMFEYLPKSKKPKVSKQQRFPTVKIKNTIIYFGKNSKQNEELSFGFAHKDWTFLHIRDYHGPHVVLAATTPSKEDLLTASEVTILLSNKEDGEVNIASIKDIKKGQFQGQVLFRNYTTITIKSIREETKKLLIK